MSTQNLLVAFSREPCISQSPFNGRAIKTGFRAASSPAVLIVHRAVLLTKKKHQTNVSVKVQNKKCQQQAQHPKHWQLESYAIRTSSVVT